MVREYGLSVSFFEPFKNGVEECGENGLPVCPNTTKIIGNGHLLSLKTHPNLQELVHVEKGKQDRIIFVTEKLDVKCRLDKWAQGPLDSKQALEFGAKLFSALEFIHRNGIVHRTLTPKNIFFDGKDLRLANWFMWSLTHCGQIAPFDHKSNIKYLPIEDVVKIVRKTAKPSHFSSDVYSAGIILLESLLGIKIWKSKKNSRQLLVEKLQLTKEGKTDNLAETVVAQLGLGNHLDEIDPRLKEVILRTTSHVPSRRPSAREILDILLRGEAGRETERTYDLFPVHSVRSGGDGHSPTEIISRLNGKDLYSLWKLATSDLYSELEKGDLIRKRPGLADLNLIPSVSGGGMIMGQGEREGGNKTMDLPLDSLESALSSFDRIAANPVTSIDLDQSSMSQTMKQISDEKRLPLPIRESSIVYQLHRILVYRRLLSGYPMTREKIRDEAAVDICPNVRGYVWSSLLGVGGDTKGVYRRINKSARRETDRQIEVDIPRCHQYEALISCPEGANKLKRIIKAWLVTNPKLTYWQGLDSLTVPFLYLHYDREDLAFATLSKFIPKYATGLFQRNNAHVIQEYLAIYQQLLSHHDPELANHLADMDGQAFVPDLYAISWFLTMFAHVFPIAKIIHLWDRMLLYDSSFPLFIGVAIMLRLKRQLLSFSFNDCILSFSDMPDIDIHDVIKSSIKLHRDTPTSCAFRVFQPERDTDGVLGMTPDFIDLAARRNEHVPRISCADVCRLNGLSRATIIGCETGEAFELIEPKDLIKSSSVVDRLLVLDIRSEDEFRGGTLPGAVNLPAAHAFEPPTEDVPFGALKSSHPAAIRLITSRGRSIIVIAATTTAHAQSFVFSLLKLGYPRLCVLHGGFDHLEHIGATLSIPQF